MRVPGPRPPRYEQVRASCLAACPIARACQWDARAPRDVHANSTVRFGTHVQVPLSRVYLPSRTARPVPMPVTTSATITTTATILVFTATAVPGATAGAVASDEHRPRVGVPRLAVAAGADPVPLDQRTSRDAAAPCCCVARSPC